MKHCATEKWEVLESAPHVCVTIEDTAQRYLRESVDCDHEVLVLTRDRRSANGKPRWKVRYQLRSELPPTAVKYFCITRLDNLTVVIPQKPHVRDLSGRVLRLKHGTLVLD
ncbi:MAG: hypothetical protein OEN20_13865 [Gammaproteobacteria bacterium]|nr:hypothetical protein [Gammaproteobacteria bacterium]